MRKISLLPILVFVSMLLLIIGMAFSSSWVVLNLLLPSVGQQIGLFLFFSLLAIYLYALLVFALWRQRFPLLEGSLDENSQGEFRYHVHLLFYLIFFNSLIRTHFIPVPIMRHIYLLLGAKLGANTYSAGALLDPSLTIAGKNCIIGHDAVLFAHAIEGTHLSLAKIQLGDNVTVGAHAAIMSGVKIADGATVAVGAVIPKGTCIAAGEVWGGVPANRIK